MHSVKFDPRSAAEGGGSWREAMVGDGLISCAYRLFGRLPPEAHSDLLMMVHDTATLIARGVSGNTW